VTREELEAEYDAIEKRHKAVIADPTLDKAGFFEGLATVLEEQAEWLGRVIEHHALPPPRLVRSAKPGTARTRLYRKRLRDRKSVLQVEVGDETIGAMISAGYVDDARSSDRVFLGRSVEHLLADWTARWSGRK
jgi:hypothetical protein